MATEGRLPETSGARTRGWDAVGDIVSAAKILVVSFNKGRTGCRKPEFPMGCQEILVLHSAERFPLV